MKHSIQELLRRLLGNRVTQQALSPALDHPSDSSDTIDKCEILRDALDRLSESECLKPNGNPISTQDQEDETLVIAIFSKMKKEAIIDTGSMLDGIRDGDMSLPFDATPMDCDRHLARYIRMRALMSGIVVRYANENPRLFIPDRRTLALPPEGKLEELAQDMARELAGHTHSASPEFKVWANYATREIKLLFLFLRYLWCSAFMDMVRLTRERQEFADIATLAAIKERRNRKLYDEDLDNVLRLTHQWVLEARYWSELNENA